MESLLHGMEPSLNSLREWAFGLGIPDSSPLSLLETIKFAKSPAQYDINIHTGTVSGAGTDADVFITLYGEWNTFPESKLDNDDH